MKQPKYVGESMKASAAARSDKSGAGAKYPKMTAGAGGGAGRLEKASKYGAKK